MTASLAWLIIMIITTNNVHVATAIYWTITNVENTSCTIQISN